MRKKNRDASFRFSKTSDEGIRFQIRFAEALALVEMLRPYAKDMWNDKKMSITDQLLACNCTEIYRKLEQQMLFHRPVYKLTFSRAQALAFYEEVFTTRLYSENITQKIVMQNMFTAIDKTLI